MPECVLELRPLDSPRRTRRDSFVHTSSAFLSSREGIPGQCIDGRESSAPLLLAAAAEQTVLAQELPEGAAVLFHRTRGAGDVALMGREDRLEEIMLEAPDGA